MAKNKGRKPKPPNRPAAKSANSASPAPVSSASSASASAPATLDAPPKPSPPAAAVPAVAAARPVMSQRPAWQRNRVFRFFSSVKLAVVLLSVIIVASAVGTVYESSFDAKVARYYVYEASWFNCWLLLLCANLACAAFSRMPWKRHHTGFLVTHLGIIILLFGALIGRLWGVEGTMTLFKDRPPNNQLIIDQRVLRITENGSTVRPLPVAIIGRRPTPQQPWAFGYTPAGWKIELTDYAPLLSADFEPQTAPVPGGGRPAVRVRLVSKRLNQRMESWLLVDDSEHNSLDLGLASVQLRRGTAPATTASTAANPAPAVPPDAVDESIVAFALKPGQQVSQTAPNAQASGIKVRLEADAAKRKVFIDWRGATWDFDFEADRNKEHDLSGSGLSITVRDYWPDFVLKEGQPASASDQPNNPAVLVQVRGKLPAPSAEDAGPAAAVVDAATPGPMMGGADNQATVYCDDSGALTFTLKSGASPDPIRGALKVGEPVNTGWADWQLEAAQVLPNALAQTTFRPTVEEEHKPGMMSGGHDHTEGIKVRLSRNGESHEEWAAVGWSVSMPTSGQVTEIGYGFRIEQLPVGYQLTDFHVERDEGNDNPAGFKSTLRVTDINGGTGTGSCSMNQPFNHPGNWWNTFSGLTFKVSQASWNPENLNQSTIQILRDPGWLFKWVGSLLICAGIFTLFYLRPAPKLNVPGAKEAKALH